MLRSLPALGAFFVVTIALAACGDSVPGNSVASVDGENDHARPSSPTGSASPRRRASRRARPRSPTRRRTTPPASRTRRRPRPSRPRASRSRPTRSSRPSASRSTRVCATRSCSSSSSRSGSPARPRTRASRSPPRRPTSSSRTPRSSPSPRRRTSRSSSRSPGMTLNDAKFQVRFNTVYTKLREKAVKNAGEGHRQGRRRLLQEEQGALRDARHARPARRAHEDRGARPTRPRRRCESGQSWNAVAKKYSIDQASKDQGGSLLGHRQGHAGEVLRRRDLRAPRRASSPARSRRSSATTSSRCRRSPRPSSSR